MMREPDIRTETTCIPAEGGVIHIKQVGGDMAAWLYIASEDIMTAPRHVTLSSDGVESLIKELQRLIAPPKSPSMALEEWLDEMVKKWFAEHAPPMATGNGAPPSKPPETIEERLARLEEIVLDDGGTCGPEIVGWWPGRDEVR